MIRRCRHQRNCTPTRPIPPISRHATARAYKDAAISDLASTGRSPRRAIATPMTPQTNIAAPTNSNPCIVPSPPLAAVRLVWRHPTSRVGECIPSADDLHSRSAIRSPVSTASPTEALNAPGELCHLSTLAGVHASGGRIARQAGRPRYPLAVTVAVGGGLGGVRLSLPDPAGAHRRPAPRHGSKIDEASVGPVGNLHLGIDQAQKRALDCRLHSRCHAELSNHVTDVKIDCSFADVHEHGDVCR